MSRNFILSCESTVDVPFSYMEERDVPVLFYSYMVDETEYIDDMCRDPKALPNFYAMLEAGKLPATSQINEFKYYDFFKELLEQGDVLHIAFGSGMTPSVINARKAADKLKEEYPQRTLIVIDSLCSSSGYGLLVDAAIGMRDKGCPKEEIAEWVLANRNKVHHQFYTTDLKHFRRSGRVSGAAATVGSILNICPLMHLNAEGRIIAYDKVRGKVNALKRTVAAVEAHAQGGTDYDQKCWICHSNCPADAEKTKAALEERFPKMQDLRIFDIGTIIASHCGPGTVAVFFFGDERSEK